MYFESERGRASAPERDWGEGPRERERILGQLPAECRAGLGAQEPEILS